MKSSWYLEKLISSDYYNSSHLSKEIWLKTREFPIVIYRQILTYLIFFNKIEKRMSQFSRLINKDHTTVIYSRRRIKELIEINDKLIVEEVTKMQKNIFDVKL